MPDEFAPKKRVRLAQPGEVPGYGHPIRRDQLDGDYADAAPIAYANPGVPVIVHEWARPDDGEKRRKLYSRIAQETAVSLKLMTAADHAAELKIPDDVQVLAAPHGLERFQVSISAGEAEAWRTYIVFHPNGRPRRQTKQVPREGMPPDEEQTVEASYDELGGENQAPGPQGEPVGDNLARGGGPVA
jgi:hypothetical protein